MTDSDEVSGTVPVFSEVPGSPVQAGSGEDPPRTQGGMAIAGSPAGYFAVSNFLDDTVSTFAASPQGLAPVGTPVSSGPNPLGLSFSPDGELLAVGNLDSNSPTGSVTFYEVSIDGGLAQLGSPLPAGASPRAVAFSPRGDLVAVANVGDGTVSTFSVAPGGAPSRVDGSPFGVGAQPTSVAFSPDGTRLAVAHWSPSAVSVHGVGPTGAVLPGGQSYPAGAQPSSVAYSPDGTLVAVANVGSPGSVSIYAVQPGGALAPVGGPPDKAAFYAAAFTPGGRLLTVVSADGRVWAYAVASGGGLTAIPGSPFKERPAPSVPDRSPRAGWLAYSQNGRYLAVANTGTGTVSLFVTGLPRPVIDSPPDGSTFGHGVRVLTDFSCSAAPGGPAITSCVDDAGATSPGRLDTSTDGFRTYRVTATAGDGIAESASINYRVLAHPFSPAGSAPAGTHPAAVRFSSLERPRRLAIADAASSQVRLFDVASDGTLQQLPDSPFSVGSSPTGLLFSLAYDNGGGISQVVSVVGASGITPLTIDPTGTISRFSGSPFATGTNPLALAHSLGATHRLAVANADGTVAMYQQGSRAVTPLGAPVATGVTQPTEIAVEFSDLVAVASREAQSVALLSGYLGTLTRLGSPLSFHSPPAVALGAFYGSPRLLAVTEMASGGGLHVYTVDLNGAIEPVPGSPLPTGSNPTSVAFRGGASGLVATANSGDGTVSCFSFPRGRLVEIPGSPFGVMDEPLAVTFSPGGSWLAVIGTHGGSGMVSIIDTKRFL